jgi:O-antigen ligase
LAPSLTVRRAEGDFVRAGRRPSGPVPSGNLRAGAFALLMAAQLSRWELVAEGLIVLAVLVCYLPALASGRLGRVAMWGLAFVAYWLLSALAVGTLPGSTGELNRWLNGEGRVLVAATPLLLLGNIAPSQGDLRWFRRTLSWMALVNAGLYAMALLGVDPFAVVQDGLYFGFTSSHHASGMWGGVAVVVHGMAITRRGSTTSLIPLGAALVVVAGSGSRTTLLGLTLVAVWFALKRATLGQRITLAVALPLVLVAMARTIPHIGETLSWTDQAQVAQSRDLFAQGVRQESVATLPRIAPGQLEAVANIQTRFGAFGFAAGRWISSPLVGMGSGRYDNVSLRYAGVPHVIYLAVDGTRMGDDYADAHNNFLQALAENGAIGLFLLMAAYGSAYRAGGRRGSVNGARVQALVVFSLGTAMTGATLMSPALTFAAMTAILVYLGSTHESA